MEIGIGYCRSEWLELLIKLFQLYVISCPVVVKDFIPNACCVGDEGSDVHQISLDSCTVSVIGSYYLVPELTIVLLSLISHHFS